MAKLPRFQESGLISADVPRLDFANVRESGRFSQSIAENLDRISSFAFGEAQKQQKEQNRILGIQLRADLESEVQKELTNLDVMVETGQLSNFEDIQNRVKSLQGMARGLAEVDPEQANGLMRSISTGGGVLLRKSSDLLVKAYGASQDIKTEETIGNLRKNLETLYSVETDPEMIAQYESGARNIAFAMAAQNPTTLPAKLEAFEKARVAARNTAMTNFFVSTEFATRPSDALTKLRAGDAGKYSPLWAQMDEGQRDSVVQSMLKRQADDLQIIDRDNKLSIERNRAANYADYDEFYRGVIGGDELLGRMSTRGYVPSRDELRAIREGDIPGAPPQFFGALEYKARLGQMGLEQANQYFTEKRISLKQRNTLFGLIDKTEDRAFARAKDKIRNAFVPNPFDPSTKRGAERRAEIESHLIGMMQVAQRDGKPFDVEAAADILIANKQQSIDYKELVDARQRLRQKLDEIGLEYREDYTAETLKRSGKGNAVQHGSIIKLVNAIKDNK